MSFNEDFNIFVAGKIGLLKGIKATQEQFLSKNLHAVRNLTPESEVTAMIWGDPQESDIVVGTKGQNVKIYDTEFKAMSSCVKLNYGTGPIVGLSRFQDATTTCTSSGHVKVLKSNQSKVVEFCTNGECEKMTSAGHNSSIIATGGRENDLKLWDLNISSQVFTAKNARNNELDLRVPVWVSDIKIVPETEYKIVTSSRYGHVRIYDTKTQRRSVLDHHIQDQSLMCVDLAYRELQAVVASGTGHMFLVDFRMGGRVVHSFKGATGSIRQIVCHKTRPYLVSVGLDSYMRLHNVDTKELLLQRYMQVKLNCVLMRSNFIFENEKQEVEESPAPITDGVIVEDYDALFDKMETIGGKKRKLMK